MKNHCLNFQKPVKFVYCSNKCQQYFQRPAFNELKKDSTRKLRLLEFYGHVCSTCQLSEWLGKPITLELDHVDGHHENNDWTNLRLLCPNCHSQTPTYKAKNKGNGRKNRR